MFNDPNYNCDVYKIKLGMEVSRRTEPDKYSEWQLFTFREYWQMAGL